MSSPALIFDMDGVLLDSEQVYQEIERQMFRDLGIPVSPGEHRQFMGSTEKALWGFMVEKYTLTQTAEALILEERRQFIDRLEKGPGIPLIEGLIPLLNSLNEAEIPMIVASSSAKKIIQKVLFVKKLDQYFKGFVSGEEVPHPKPAPDIFLEAASRLEVLPSQCLVIEDSENGVKAAISAGIKVIGLQCRSLEGVDLTDTDTIVRDHTDINVGMIHSMLDR